MVNSIWHQLKVEAYKITDSKWPRAWIAASILASRTGPSFFSEIAQEAIKYHLSAKTIQRGLRELEKLNIIKRGERGEYELDPYYKAVVQAALLILDKIKEATEKMDKGKLSEYDERINKFHNLLEEEQKINWFTINLIKYLKEVVRLARIHIEKQAENEKIVNQIKHSILEKIL